MKKINLSNKPDFDKECLSIGLLTHKNMEGKIGTLMISWVDPEVFQGSMDFVGELIYRLDFMKHELMHKMHDLIEKQQKEIGKKGYDPA